MNFTNEIAQIGTFQIDVYDRDHNFKQSKTIHNMIVQTGLEMIASIIANDKEINAPTKIKISNSIVNGIVPESPRDVTLNDTDLVGDISQTNLFDDQDGIVIKDNTVTFQATFLENQPQCNCFGIREVGLFNNEDVMLNRVTFEPITKYFDDIVKIRYTIVFNSQQGRYDTTAKESLTTDRG